jgi:radical SAM-linked protein
MPKISFEDSLPIGMESLCETFYLTVKVDTQPETFAKKLNEEIPEGLSITACREYIPEDGKKSRNKFLYQVSLMSGTFCKESLKIYEMSEKFEIEKTNKNGKKKLINLKELIKRINMVSHNRLEMILYYDSDNIIRPTDVIKKIFHLNDEEIKTARVVKYNVSDLTY